MKLIVLKVYCIHLISLFIASIIVEIIDTKSLIFLTYGWNAWKMLIILCIFFSGITTYAVIGFQFLMKEINTKSK